MRSGATCLFSFNISNLPSKQSKGCESIQRDTLSEATVTLRTVVTFVTWLISRTEFLF